jgi:hypothetical protein
MTLDPELQRLIESAREADLPDDLRLSRVGEQLLRQMAPIGAGAASTTHATVSAKTAASGVGLAVKAAGILSAVGLAVWSLQHVSQRSTQPARPVTVERSETRDQASSVTNATRPAVLPPIAEVAGASAPQQPTAAGTAPKVEPPTPRRRHARAPVHERTAPAERANDFAGELALMERAVQARRAGQLAEARALVEEHARCYPQGALRAERERLAAQLTSGTPAE